MALVATRCVRAFLGGGSVAVPTTTASATIRDDDAGGDDGGDPQFPHRSDRLGQEGSQLARIRRRRRRRRRRSEPSSRPPEPSTSIVVLGTWLIVGRRREHSHKTFCFSLFLSLMSLYCSLLCFSPSSMMMVGTIGRKV
jgi:hypothetical protein